MRPGSRRSLLIAACAVVVATLLVPGGARRLSATPNRGTEIVKVLRAPSPFFVEEAPPIAHEVTTTLGHPAAAEVTKTVPALRTASAPAEAATRSVDKGIYQVHATADSPQAPPGAVATSGPCAHATTCPDFELRTARWKTDTTGTAPIVWKFNDEGRRNLRAPAGLLESTVRSAMSEWSKWDSNIVFSYGGTTTAHFGDTGKDGSCADGTNTITWDRFDPDIIAVAGTCTDNTGRIVRDADLALNVTYHWEDISGTPKSRHSFDIRSIVTHELGHWLGLLDLYSSQDVHQTMSGYSQYGETNKRTPSLGDVMGIQKAFPCDAKDSCPRKGIAND